MIQNLKETKPRFIHLRAHSDYSIIDGLAKIKALVKQTVLLNMPALAITDFTNLFGIIKFYEEAHIAGIKPLIGADFCVHSEIFYQNTSQITVLAMNNTGYRNLILLISRAYQKGYNSTFGPSINNNWLAELNEGILIISNGRTGDIGKNLLRKKNSLVKNCLTFYQKYFPNRFYLELTRTGRPNEENYIHAAIELAYQYQLPVVATNDIRFINKSDFDAHEIRVAIHNGFSINDPHRPRNYSPQQYMRSEIEMCELFSDIPEALKNSVEIAKRCNVFMRLDQHFLPKFPTGNMSSEDFLTMEAKKGLGERLTSLNIKVKKNNTCFNEYKSRLDMELEVINKIGFSGYFLIVMEFVQWAKKNGVPVGPGRGSGAGSLVAYALKITDIDPIAFNLIFERFLNKERISMPDFDIDFCMENRDQVIEHVSDMYGRNSVSQIATFGTMAAKGAIRDVGRALGYPYNFVDKISKMIPSDAGISIMQAFKIEPKLLDMYQSNEEVKSLIDTACKLEGTIRNIGKHAGGVVISPTKITDFSPIYCDSTGENPLTQFDKDDIERVGLVKFDFLGLRTLTIINLALKMINHQRSNNGKQLLDISAIPLDDKKSFELLQRAETTAVFQLESPGMRDLIKRLKPDSFEDMIALVALFRPGPLQSGMVDNFINRKHGREKISYPDISCQHIYLKKVLESTYGIILYQEQVMQIAQVLSGYTLGNADILRRAMSKKKPEEMLKQRSFFEEGAKKNGIDSKLALKIFDLVEKFSGYGFNKSHSAAYALISYQTLWLKTHYPAEFMAAVMTADIDNVEKLAKLVDECRRMGLTILPPDVNSGLYSFIINNNKEIIYGMGAIKGIGESLIEEILKARKNGGYFRDLFDLCSRIDTKKINYRSLEKLIMAGALDSFGLHRAALIQTLENTLKAANQRSKNIMIGQSDMFGNLKEEMEQYKQSCQNCQPWPKYKILNGERETLGLYLTGHPIDQYSKEIYFYIGNSQLKDVCPTEYNKVITVAGIVIFTKILINKRGNRIGMCTLDDRSGRLEVILFTDVLDKYQTCLKNNNILIVTGQVVFSSLREEIKIVAQKIIDINQARGQHARKLILSLTESQMNDKLLKQLRLSLEPYRSKSYCLGTIPVYLCYKKQGALVTLRFCKTWFISPKEKLLHELHSLIGENQVNLVFS